jgi:hypothetical protein
MQFRQVLSPGHGVFTAHPFHGVIGSPHFTLVLLPLGQLVEQIAQGPAGMHS